MTVKGPPILLELHSIAVVVVVVVVVVSVLPNRYECLHLRKKRIPFFSMVVFIEVSLAALTSSEISSMVMNTPVADSSSLKVTLLAFLVGFV